jgi:hypothetical protein
MNLKTSGPAAVAGSSGQTNTNTLQPSGVDHADQQCVLVDTLLAILEGCSHASALMPWEKPGPIRLPDDAAERRALIRAHIVGEPARVLSTPQGKRPSYVQISKAVLAALCPASDGLMRFIAVDLDAADGHGAGGLVDPVHAMRCFSEQADMFSLSSGLFAVRSRSGRGRHLWLIPPEPVALAEAVLVAAFWGAAAHRVATRDVEDGDGAVRHAFRCGDGLLAIPGKAGAVELYPRSTDRPPLGWALALPGSGAMAARGGGSIVDPLTDHPRALTRVPRCEPKAWQTVVSTARQAVAARRPTQGHPGRSVHGRKRSRDVWERIDPRTRELLDGRTPPGQRNQAAFGATCNLLGIGMDRAETQRLVLAGATASGLTEREARSAVQSGFRAKGVIK